MKPCPAVTSVLLGWCAIARADPSNADLATANALYSEGKRLLGVGQIDQACARYEASMALAPRLGVQISLAQCYEQAGKTASAWLAYGEAAALAHRLADTREAVAWQQHKALTDRLGRISITAAGADVVVRRDGAVVPRSAYGIGVPVDPGEHTLDATAPGHLAWAARIRVARAGETVEVAVPALAREPAPPPPEAAPPPPRRPSLASWLTLGGGVAAITTGIVLDVSARSLWRQAQPGCDSSNACSERALAQIARSRRDSTLATRAFAIGGAAVIAGAWLYVRASRRIQIAPVLSHDTLGLAVAGGL